MNLLKNSWIRRLCVSIYRFLLHNLGFLVYGRYQAAKHTGIWDLRGDTALRVRQADLKLELERSVLEHQTYDQLEVAAWRRGWVTNTTH